MTVEPVKSSDLITRLAGVIWGDAKTGKTTWAMSLPGRKLLINFDPDGYLSVAHRDDFDVIDLSVLPPHEQVEEAKKAANYVVQNADKYRSVIVDSITTLVSAALEYAIYHKIGKSATFTPTLDAPGLAAWGSRNNQANDVIAKILRATGVNKQHCFFIAHADDPEYDLKGENIVKQTLMLSAKVRNPVGLKVSEIYHLGLASGNRRTVYLAPFGVITPMGSRIFDTSVVSRFDLKYSPDLPDEEQATSLVNIIAKFEANGKMKEVPK